jgi:hypothetical protein
MNNCCKKKKTDNILRQASMLFANCEKTPEARAAARAEERVLLAQLKSIDFQLYKIVCPDETNDTTPD